MLHEPVAVVVVPVIVGLVVVDLDLPFVAAAVELVVVL